MQFLAHSLEDLMSSRPKEDDDDDDASKIGIIEWNVVEGETTSIPCIGIPREFIAKELVK